MKNIHLIPTHKPSRLLKTIPKGNLILSKSITSGSHWKNQNIYITSNDEKIKEGDWFLEKAGRQYPIHWNGKDKLNYHCKKIILTTDQDLIKDGVQAIDNEFLEWFVKNPSCEEVEIESWQTKGEWDLDYKIIIPKEEPNKTHYLDELPNMDKNVLAKMWADAMPKYPIGGYAPGLYSCVCVSCKKEFMGDKRAVQCEPCAIEMVNTKITINDRGGIETVKQETLEEAAERWNEKQTTLEFGKPHNAPNRIKSFIEGVKWQQERSYSEGDMRKAFIAGGNSCIEEDDDYGSLYDAYMENWFKQFKKK